MMENNTQYGINEIKAFTKIRIIIALKILFLFELTVIIVSFINIYTDFFGDENTLKLGIILSFLLPLLIFIFIIIEYFNSLKLLKKDNITVHYKLYDNKFSVQINNSHKVKEFFYVNLFKVFIKEDHIIIFVTRKSGYVISKKDFIKSDLINLIKILNIKIPKKIKFDKNI